MYEFIDELGSSPRSSSRALGSSFSGSMRSALPDYPSSRAPSSQSKHDHLAQRVSKFSSVKPIRISDG